MEKIVGKFFKKFHSVLPFLSVNYYCRCKMDCFAKLDQNDMDFCISKINDFSTKDEQDIFLQLLIEKFSIKQRRPRKENATQRQSSFQFYVLKENDKVKVCKKAFISLYGVTEARVRRLCDLLNRGNPRVLEITEAVIRKLIQCLLKYAKKYTNTSSAFLEKRRIMQERKLTILMHDWM